MAESKSSLEGEGKWEFKVRNDLDNECKARCVGMDCKRRRKLMAKLRKWRGGGY